MRRFLFNSEGTMGAYAPSKLLAPLLAGAEPQVAVAGGLAALLADALEMHRNGWCWFFPVQTLVSPHTVV